MNIKIVGCGSAGNHIAFAFKDIAKKILMTDVNKKNLNRSKNSIYLKRYKKWDEKISLMIEGKDNLNYDLIIISTPPKTHYKIAKMNIKKTRSILIEKPLCHPGKKAISQFRELIKNNPKINFFCGYNHRLFPSSLLAKKIFDKYFDRINSIDISFKENTSGFLKAHSWFKSLDESYLSSIQEGGGALFEHSHAINFYYYLFSDKSDNEKILNVEKIFQPGKRKYDNKIVINLQNKSKLIKIEQNFITNPPEKKVILYGKGIFLELIFNHNKSNDKITFINNNKKKVYYFKKNRADDFIYESEFIKKFLKQKNKVKNLISIESGLKTIDLANRVL